MRKSEKQRKIVKQSLYRKYWWQNINKKLVVRTIVKKKKTGIQVEKEIK